MRRQLLRKEKGIFREIIRLDQLGKICNNTSTDYLSSFHSILHPFRNYLRMPVGANSFICSPDHVCIRLTKTSMVRSRKLLRSSPVKECIVRMPLVIRSTSTVIKSSGDVP